MPSSPDERLWSRIVELRVLPPSSMPATDWFSQNHERQQRLVDAAQQYLTSYPGGDHRDECIEIELATLFELGGQAGTLDALYRRIQEYIQSPPSPFAIEEAAWWMLMAGPTELAVNRAVVPERLGTSSPARIAAIRRYITDYPASRHTPWLAEQLFADAWNRGDRATMQDLVDRITAKFDRHPSALWMAAKLHQFTSLGEPVRIHFRAIERTFFDTADDRGQPVFIVVWSGFDPASVEAAHAIEQLRESRPNFRVYGVNLDESVARTDEMAALAELPWPQWNDGLGWGHEFVRTWGIRQIPAIMWIGADGTLCGVAEGAAWAPFAEAALSESSP